MADKTKIEWAEASWNPVTGCTPISEGCQNCYAANMARRFWGNRKFSDIKFHPERLEQPLKWKKPRMIFVCSMGDLFHERVPFKWFDEVIRIATKAHWHTYLFLTKRPDVLKKAWYPALDEWENFWLGVTAENQKKANERIPKLLEVSAAVRFVSIEPMLEPIDMTKAIYGPEPRGMNAFGFTDGFGYEACIQWVICGAETGPGARPMAPAWARDLRDQCKSAGVPFFFKKMGNNKPIPDDLMIREYPNAL